MATNSQIAFAPLGNSIAITADVTAPTGVQALILEKNRVNSPGQYRVVNPNAVIVHLGVGPTAAKATANAVAAAAGVPAAGIPIAPNSISIMRFTDKAYFSAVAASAQTVFITPGEGL